jgi:hypothetical protein
MALRVRFQRKAQLLLAKMQVKCLSPLVRMTYPSPLVRVTYPSLIPLLMRVMHLNPLVVSMNALYHLKIVVKKTKNQKPKKTRRRRRRRRMMMLIFKLCIFAPYSYMLL